MIVPPFSSSLRMNWTGKSLPVFPANSQSEASPGLIEFVLSMFLCLLINKEANMECLYTLCILQAVQIFTNQFRFGARLHLFKFHPVGKNLMSPQPTAFWESIPSKDLTVFTANSQYKPFSFHKSVILSLFLCFFFNREANLICSVYSFYSIG